MKMIVIKFDNTRSIRKNPSRTIFRGPVERKVPAILSTLTIPRNPQRYSYKKKTGIVSKVVISSE